MVFLFFFLLCPWVKKTAVAGDFHVGSKNLYCSDCHTIHYSQDGGVSADWGQAGPYERLLKNLTNEMCLMCHDGTDTSAPNVLGEERYISSAGELSIDPNSPSKHSLGSTVTPPGYSGTWSGDPLTCITCHNPHGNDYYRNLRTNPGQAVNITVTYETGTYGGDVAVQQLLDTPLAEHYKVGNIKHRQSESDNNYGLSAWCAGCHGQFYGDGGDANMGGSSSGDTQALDTDTWIRHPTVGITLAQGVTNLHIDGTADGGLGYWWSSLVLSRPPYISPLGEIGTKSVSDNETGCTSCHKAHGSDQLFCLMYDDPETSTLEDGSRMVGTCQACHLRGGTDDEDNGIYDVSPHGHPDTGLSRDDRWLKGECNQCHLQHVGKDYNLFTDNTNALCYTTGCHDFTPTGGYSGYPAQEEDRAPAGSDYPGYFEYFVSGAKAPGLNNRVAWPGMDVFENPNTWDDGPPQKFFSPHRNDPDMPIKDSSGVGRCVNCHSPHGTGNAFDMLIDTYLSTKGSSQGDEPLNYELCLKCHDHDGPAGMDSENKNISHYYNKSINPETAGHMIRKSTNSASYWPDHIQVGDRLACSNCHNPHGTRGHADIGLPNAYLLSDQRPGYDGIIDTKTMASQCRPFCFSCHVPSDDPNCTLYNGQCPEVDGIVMAAIPELEMGQQSHHESDGTTHCYNCHGKDYDVTSAASPAFNVHNPKPKPGKKGQSRLKSVPLPPLAPPSGFIATAGKRLVELSWEKYPDENIRGYHLYRSQTPGGPYALISSEPDHVNRYMDKEVSPEQNYYYVLTVEDMPGMESTYSEEARATPVSLTPKELKTLEEVKGLSAKIEGDTICLTWEEDLDELVAGYYVYRRLEGEGPQWVRITRYEPLRWPVYEDRKIVKGKVYLYTVAAVDSMGNEARFPKEVRVSYEALYIFSVSLSQGEIPLKGGRQMVATLTGSPGQRAYFTIEGLAEPIFMEETDGTGTYIGKYLIPGETDQAQLKVTGFLDDGRGKIRSKESPFPLKIDNLPPPAPARLEAALNSDGSVSLLWPAAEEADEQIASYRIYRGLNEGITPDVNSRLASDLPPDRREYKDFDLRPDTRYYYLITSVDEAENESAPSSIAEVFVPPDTIPPFITEIRVIGEKEVWNLGENISLLMIGEPGCKAAFSLGGRIKDIVMIESFEKGRYEGKYVFQDVDEAEGMIITGRLTDPSGNSTSRTLSNRVSVVRRSAGAKPEIYAIEEDSFQVGGSVGLVTGDLFKIIVRGTPGCKGAFHLGAFVNEDRTVSLDWSGFSESDNPDISAYRIYRGTWPAFSPDKQNPLAMLGLGAREYQVTDNESDLNDSFFITAVNNDGHPRLISTPKRNIALMETDDPGTYESEYTVLPTERIIQGYVFASLRDEFGQYSLPFRSSHTITMDTESRIEVRPLPPELKADSLSRGRVLALLKNARGRGIADRQVGVTLFASSEYTGLVGLGKLNQADIGYVVNPLFGINDPTASGESYVFTTDGFGQISMEYQTGFAAKTIIFRAEDQITGDVGFGYLTSYLETQAQVEQYLPIEQAKARMRARGQEYYLSLSASPQWLTADGVGRSQIKAELIDRTGTPVKGHRITFIVSMGDGYLQPREAYTDAGGKAEVKYVAGRSIGTVEITATDVTATPPLGAKTHIILKSDAPAVLEVSVKPERIPADGKSTCTLTIKVTDINKNPCRGVAPSVRVISGGGKILKIDEITDFSGQARAVYQAGKEPGTAKFNVRVTSKIPTSKELEEIRWTR